MLVAMRTDCHVSVARLAIENVDSCWQATALPFGLRFIPGDRQMREVTSSLIVVFTLDGRLSVRLGPLSIAIGSGLAL